MKRNPDSVLNVLGKTTYIDDMPENSDMLHAAIVLLAVGPRPLYAGSTPRPPWPMRLAFAS